MLITSAAALSKITGADICENIRTKRLPGFWRALLTGLFFLICTFVGLHLFGFVHMFTIFMLVFAAICLGASLWTLFFILNPARCSIFKEYGSPELLAQLVQHQAEKHVYSDNDIILTEQYIMSSDFEQIVPLKTILLFFGYSQENYGKFVRVWDEKAKETFFRCQNPWHICQLMMPYMSGKARYSENDAELRALAEQIKEYAKENR